MPVAYTWLKAVHVISVMLWLGGGFTMGVLTARISRTEDRKALAGFLRGASFYGPRFAGGGSVVALLAGLAMMYVGHVSFKTLWISIGLLGMLIHFPIGAGVIPRRIAALEKLLSDANTNDAQIEAHRSRFLTLTVVYLTLMFAVVAVMVVKPTL